MATLCTVNHVSLSWATSGQESTFTPAKPFYPSHRAEAILNIDRRFEVRFLSKSATNLNARNLPLPSRFSYTHDCHQSAGFMARDPHVASSKAHSAHSVAWLRRMHPGFLSSPCHAGVSGSVGLAAILKLDPDLWVVGTGCDVPGPWGYHLASVPHRRQRSPVDRVRS